MVSCLNGGQQVRHGGRAMCQCTYYYSGDTCQLRSYGTDYGFQSNCNDTSTQTSQTSVYLIIIILLTILLLLIFILLYVTIRRNLLLRRNQRSLLSQVPDNLNNRIENIIIKS